MDGFPVVCHPLLFYFIISVGAVPKLSVAIPPMSVSLVCDEGGRLGSDDLVGSIDIADVNINGVDCSMEIFLLVGVTIVLKEVTSVMMLKAMMVPVVDAKRGDC